MQKQALWSRDFISICISSFFVFMNFYILAVTLPKFVVEELHGSQADIGLVTTVFVIAGIIFRPITGKWLDERSRKKILFAGLIIFTICSVLYLFIADFNLLLALRIVHGIGFGMAATATSAIAVDTVPLDRKGQGIGYFSLFMSLAMVVGPFVGLTIAASYNFTVLFVWCTAFSFLSMVFGMMTRIPARAAKIRLQRSWHWRSFIELKALPISLSGCVLAFSYGAITTFLSVYSNEIGLEAYASYFFMVFAAAILISRPFTGRVFDRLGEHVLVYPGIALFVIGMIGLSQVSQPGVFLLTGAIIGLGFGALLPSFQTIAVRASSSGNSGLATGTYFVLFDSGYALGSYVLGVIAAQSSYRTMYLTGGFIVALTYITYYTLHHRKQMKVTDKDVSTQTETADAAL
ncbi:MFS transporter [Paenibacillus abyssi]|uniref:MFS transporter n=1 Tax=Paenibacillus abyssi TaxID=1340531 RepID=A0A917G2B3_9BACL|nr:MFS transporter [Paenibacillus abyssi]GGG19385.1 MFS transporter [Paenibacillus abyssi]